MNRRPPRNAYLPGKPLPTQLQAVGRPVTIFVPGSELMEAGTVARVNIDNQGECTYDIRGISGATFRDTSLGDLMNPQPGTFVYAT